ncbi:MAG: 2-amino-3-carboxymuconate-6-semialdehyde decarboxylase-like [Betaproteobacteria bacterium]|nr:2-amino-3-carboxymuconate-6-semialdehyde decarboxylase-like [Betaproteobacteria bacterium]
MSTPACTCTDIHNHIVPENFPAYAGRNLNVPWPSMAEAHACHRHVMISGKVYRTVADGSWSVARRISDMDTAGVTRQALSPMPELLSYWLPLDDAKVMVRFLNDQIASMIDQAPGRFVGLGCVPLQDVEAAIREMEYVMGTLKFQGVEIASHVNGVSIGDPRFEPFFAAAVKMNAAIFVHALRPAGQDRIVGAFSEQAVAFPGDIGLAVASMITGGIAERVPGLKIAFSHGGGAFAMMMPRLVRGWNAVPKAKESLPKSPREYARKFYYDCLVFDPQAVKHLIYSFGASQLMIGSDYPFNMGDTDPVGSLKAAGLDDETFVAIMQKNAERFLGLPPQ